jgi:phosphomannomutase
MPAGSGQPLHARHRARYITHLLGYIDASALKPLKLVVNAGNGGAGAVIDAAGTASALRVHQGAPRAGWPLSQRRAQPAAEENRPATIEASAPAAPTSAIAWDGDFDRCFLFDETGAFIEGYYIVGLLAAAFLQKEPGASDRARPAADLEHHRHRANGWAAGGAEQDGARLHQGADAP